MSSNSKPEKRSRLSGQLLQITLADAGIAVFAYLFMRLTTEGLAISYCDANSINLTSFQDTELMFWLGQLCFVAAIVVFIGLFFIMIGQKLSYIRDITNGIEDLRANGMNHEIPLKDNNELTSLAEAINYLAETERHLKQIERDLSHDIRTPLTAILSYSEYLKNKPEVTSQEINDYIAMVQVKAEQMKLLTDRLLNIGLKQMIDVEDGRLLMFQLCEEWEEVLEQNFNCKISLEKCPVFSRQVDIQEMRRIFDNLSSNVEKYADKDNIVEMSVHEEDERLTILQKNIKGNVSSDITSSKIGIESIKRIAEGHGGNVEVHQDEKEFIIKIKLFSV